LEYSKEQLEAINSIDGQVCIISVAGSGKTAVIVARAKRTGAEGRKIIRVYSAPAESDFPPLHQVLVNCSAKKDISIAPSDIFL